MTPAPATEQCPLCGTQRNPRADKSYSYGEILGMWSMSGVRFSNAVTGERDSAETTTLFECPRCGFGRFEPIWEGTSEFYDEVQQWTPTYYLAEKWEYREALRFIGDADRVLDVGCGEGRFLELLRSERPEGDAFGVDRSPLARETASTRGLEVGPDDMEWTNSRGPFDVITSFQVFEHVADPVGLLREMKARTAPGGAVIISVPNSEGSLRWYEPCKSNLPPHHLTRWSDKSLTALARAAGLETEEMALEPLQAEHYGHLGWWWRTQTRSLLGTSPAAHTLAEGGARGIGVAMRGVAAVGIGSIGPIRGHTVMCVMRDQ